MAALLAGCSSGSGGVEDDLQVVDNPVAATPVPSPAVSVPPAGTVLKPAGDVVALATDPATATLAVAVREPSSVLLYDLGDLDAEPRSVPLPGGAEQVAGVEGGLLASMPGAGAVARIALPEATVETVPLDGAPVSAVRRGQDTLVALPDRKAIEVLVGDEVRGTVTGQLYSADEVLLAGDEVLVLDRLRTALFDVDLGARKVGEGLRAGDGVAGAAVDSFQRVLTTDARGGALLAFSTDPLLLRQRYPVPGGVFGIAVDRERDLAWVTLTERNEVVGFDLRGGEPTEEYRFPTVRQPNSVAVDDRTGRVVVGSAAGEGTQVIQVTEP
ncbi:hypothetical protein FB471_0211 [Amycolatopsis cihanbeyliensis]|uniref:Uncharacterized protein n=1 Tax=Amycolatopsis cihanbeyliensis TaxID=1128664 RepID=A0A542DBX5_AMYCI|nr:hypothetical protein FB471_0211 [Amycolatopsis cihanbeyliensis]